MISPGHGRFRFSPRRIGLYVASALGGIAIVAGSAYASNLAFPLAPETENPRRVSGPVVADKTFVPAATRTETTWVDQGCSQWTSLGNCFMPRRVPVQQYIPVPARYVIVLRDALGNRTKVEVAESEYASCAVGDAWNECRNS
ncbi:hypothetical protein GCM10009550_57920 [Actinocorallia libanotica]|uniref:Secreted protein n=2 Tax=Actinocorallia libanotica TaxID=46162 RepID=A0ABN1RSW3_9ACTN